MSDWDWKVILGGVALLLLFFGVLAVALVNSRDYDRDCRARGGVPVHGRGIDLCLDPEAMR